MQLLRPAAIAARERRCYDLAMKRVIFLCTENSNRSQMAEAFARLHGDGVVEAWSAGSKPSGQVNPKAIAAMAEKGYDLGRHRSKSTAEAPPGPYDWVITMGCGDEASVRVLRLRDARFFPSSERCPWLEGRQREDWGLPDPRDLPPAEFNRVRDEIERRVQSLLARCGTDS